MMNSISAPDYRGSRHLARWALPLDTQVFVQLLLHPMQSIDGAAIRWPRQVHAEIFSTARLCIPEVLEPVR